MIPYTLILFSDNKKCIREVLVAKLVENIDTKKNRSNIRRGIGRREKTEKEMANIDTVRRRGVVANC
jgi:hypothetical protein